MSTVAYRVALLVCVGGAFVLGGCEAADDGADEFRGGVPRHEDVEMVVPGAAAAAEGAASVQGALLGERAELYVMTRAITNVVNGATVAVLTLLKTIVAFPPTSLGQDVAVWGPHTEPLNPNAWRLTVRRVDAGEFDYVFEAKDRTLDDTAYVTVLSGRHTVAGPQGAAHRRRRLAGPDYGSGDFVLDWDAAQRLPEHDDNVGRVHVVYARVAPTSPVSIAAEFTQVRDKETGMLVDANYAYEATPGMGGHFQFSLRKDEIRTTSALETLTVRSRWQESGAGRSDAKLVGGDLAAVEGTASECWDATFKSTFMTNSYGDAAKMWGAEGACAFVPAEYATF